MKLLTPLFHFSVAVGKRSPNAVIESPSAPDTPRPDGPTRLADTVEA